MPRVSDRLSPTVFLVSLVVAALSPLAARHGGRAAATGEGFPGWPSHYDGRVISELALSAREAAFTSGFPGRVGRFSDGEREIIVRYVASATRLLHPASDCFRGLGYAITPLPMQRTKKGQAMSCFAAKGSGGSYRVCEHLADDAGNSWPDVGAWYWDAAFKPTSRWWSYVVAERMQ